jgi:hypothetical protein
MPMLDACIPDGALSPEAEDKLLALLTGLQPAAFASAVREFVRGTTGPEPAADNA